MKSKPSKSDRKKLQMRNLEQENAKLKKKNAELQQQKTIRLNDEQLQNFLDELTQCIEWSTNKIVDETPRPVVVNADGRQKSDGFSFFLKWSIAIPFFVVAATIACVLITTWGDYWSSGLASQIAFFVFTMAAIFCAALGIEIVKEKDRNYIVSMFSALAALVALIVALVK